MITIYWNIRIMILEEIIGGLVSIVLSLVAQTPPVSLEDSQREHMMIFDNSSLQEEVCDDMVHREYEQEAEIEIPYYEELEVSVLIPAQPKRNFCESFLRSLKANIGWVMAAMFILGVLAVLLVYLELNTLTACVEWMSNNLNASVPRNVRMLQVIGFSASRFPLFAWVPISIVMLWGFNEFKKNYLICLCVSQFVAGTIYCTYNVVLYYNTTFHEFHYESKLRAPSKGLYVFSMVCCVYLVARKFKQINPQIPYGLLHTFIVLSFYFISSTLLSFFYSYVIIQFFKTAGTRSKRALIAACTPALVFPVTAIAKYLMLNKAKELIPPDRTFVMVYFLRGACIVLYRTMQSNFKDVWLFISLSLLHGVSNVLSKATLSTRIKIWKYLFEHLKRTCCGSRLVVRPLNSPRIRRLNADLEIQNILFEYTTAILSQAYFALYLVISFDVQLWQVIKESLIRIAISFAVDFVCNNISVFIQIHFYDIPMHKVWVKYWRRHVTANAFAVLCLVSYFGVWLISVFTDHKYMQSFKKEHRYRNCTSVF